MKWFSHSGDLGDIIYSLPTIRAAGGGKLILFDYPGRTAHGMSVEKMERLRPLLEQQPYIHGVEWSDTRIDCALNGFRDHCRDHGNLMDAHLATHGFSWEHRESKWLDVPCHKYGLPVVIARSARYHNPRFPWKRIVEKYKKVAGFVGTLQEHKDFTAEFGHVDFIEAGNFLELAQVIDGSQLFIGNQSAPGALSHGLFHPMIIELCPHNYKLGAIQRLNCVNGFDHKIDLPEIN